MNTQSNDIRALTDDECDSASGGVGWFVALAVLGGSAAFGSVLAIMTKGKEEVLVPKLDLPD